MNQSREIDLLHGPLLSRLIRFALPIAMSSMLQQLFHAMDTSVVGRFADANALAAVGTNGEITALLVTVSSGLAVGANVRIAHCIGEQRPQEVPSILHTALLLAGILGAGAAAQHRLCGRLLCAPHSAPDALAFCGFFRFFCGSRRPCSGRRADPAHSGVRAALRSLRSPLRRDAGDRTRRTPGRADHPRHLSAAHRMEFYRI